MKEKTQLENKITKYIQNEIYEILIGFHEICEENNLTYVLDYGTLLGAIRHEGFIPWDDDIDVSMPREDYEKFIIIVMEKMKKGETKFFLQNNVTDPQYYFPFSKLRKSNNNFKELSLKHFDIVHGPWIDIFVFDDMPLENKIFLKNIKVFNKKRKFIDYITPVLIRNNKNIVKTSIKKMVIKELENNNRIVYSFLDLKFQSLINTIERSKSYGYSGSHKMINYAFAMNSEKDIKINTIYRESFEKRLLVKFEEHYFYVPHNYDILLKDRYGDYNILPPKNERKSNHFWDIQELESHIEKNKKVVISCESR